MKTGIFASVSLILAAPALAQPAQLAQIEAALQATTTLTAAFSQTDRNGKTLTGTMALKRPGKLKFDYGRSVPYTVVADGRSLWFIDYQVRQVSRWPIARSPLAALLDPKAALTRFAKLLPSSDPRLVLVEARDPARPELGAVTLAFSRDGAAPSGLKLQGWVALDAQRNRTTVQLSGQRYNAPVADGVFAWRDPRPAARK